MFKKAGLILSVLSVSCLMATPVYIADTYFGQNPVVGNGSGISNDNAGATYEVNQDYIGAGFNITGMNVDYTGSSLKVEIYSDYFKNSVFQPEYSGYGIEMGDLFISTDGLNTSTVSNYMINDHYGIGEDWEYALMLDNSAGSSGNLYWYAFNGSSNNTGAPVILSHVPTNNMFIYRNNQEVQVDDAAAGLLAGTWVRNNAGSLAFNVTNTTPLADASELGFHWAPTCANDVIEGNVKVPEPATILLLGFGLVLVGIGSRKKR